MLIQSMYAMVREVAYIDWLVHVCVRSTDVCGEGGGCAGGLGLDTVYHRRRKADAESFGGPPLASRVCAHGGADGVAGATGGGGIPFSVFLGRRLACGR